MQPSQSHKEWASLLRSRLGGETAVAQYLDDTGNTAIHILTSKSNDGIVAATVGLMEVEQGRSPGTRIRSEILMDRRGQDSVMCNILATIAFYIIKNGWRVRPGVIYESLVAMYLPDTKLPHIYFTAPFQWNDMGRVDLTAQVIFPLVAIPVSEAESQLAAVGAGRELEALWVSQGTDVLNWERESAA